MFRQPLAWMASALLAVWVAAGLLAIPAVAFADDGSGPTTGRSAGPTRHVQAKTDSAKHTKSSKPTKSGPRHSGSRGPGPRDSGPDAATPRDSGPDFNSTNTAPDEDSGSSAGDNPGQEPLSVAENSTEPAGERPEGAAEHLTGPAETPSTDPSPSASIGATQNVLAAAGPAYSTSAYEHASTPEVTALASENPADRDETVDPDKLPRIEVTEVKSTALAGTVDAPEAPAARFDKAIAMDHASVRQGTAPPDTVVALRAPVVNQPNANATLLNAIGTLFFAVFDFITRVLEGPAAVPARLDGLVTVGRSRLEIDCGDGYTAYADWYFPTSDVPPTGLIYFQHGWPGRAGFYNETAAELAVRTNSIVVAPSITGNLFACDGCLLGSDQMSYAVAKLFTGDRTSLTASASAAAGHDVVLPRSYILAGHSAGGQLAGGVAGYAAQIAELSGKPLELAGVLLFDSSAFGGAIERGLAKLPTDVPVLSLSAEPASLNGFSDLDPVLDTYRPGVFTGLRLAGATHGDFSQSTNPLVQFGMNLSGGWPTPVNTEAVLTISQGWIADMFAGTVYEPANRTGIYGERGTSIEIQNSNGTAHAYVLPGPVHELTFIDRISLLMSSSLAGLQFSPCAADIEKLLDQEFGAMASTSGAAGSCQV